MVVIKQIQIALGFNILVILAGHHFSDGLILGSVIYHLQTQAKQDHGNKKQPE